MAKIGDVCAFKIDTLSAAYNGKIDYIDISAVDNREKKITQTAIVLAKDAPSRAKQLVEHGDVIVSLVRPNLNAVAIIEEQSQNLQVASTGYCVLRCNQMIYNRYLFYFCQSETFVNSMTAQATGASYPAVSNSIVKNCEIPLPERNKQKEIADILDKVTSLIFLRKQQLAKLDELVKARFVEMFGDPADNVNNLPASPMTAICQIIDGDRGKNYPKQEEFSDSGFCLFLNAKNVTAQGFSFENCTYITEEKDALLRNGKLCRGDVVLTTRGTIGNLAFYDTSVPYENIRINSGMVILRMNKQVVSEIFFIEQFKMQLDSIKSRIASGSAQPQLPISTMNKIDMILPPIELQKQFAAFVERVDQQKQTVQQSLEKLELMKKALTQEYFG